MPQSSVRNRNQVNEYVAGEENQIKAAAQVKVSKHKAEVDARLKKFFANTVLVCQITGDSGEGLDHAAYHLMERGNINQTQAQQSATFQKFIDELEESGTTISADAQQKLVIYAVTQPLVDLTKISNWRKAYDRLNGLGIFNGEIAVKPEPAAPAKKLTIDDVSTLSRSGNKLARALANESIIAEATPLFHEFVEFIRSTYEIPFDENQQRQVLDFCSSRNLGFNAKAYNAARVHVLGLLTPAEVKDREMTLDSHTLTSREFALKYKINKGSSLIGL
jgi:hypothetical protein